MKYQIILNYSKLFNVITTIDNIKHSLYILPCVTKDTENSNSSKEHN